MREIQYLKEMGIQSWDLLHPSRLSGYQAEKIEIPESCSLLLVSPVKPQGDAAIMLEKIVKSMHLELAQVLHIFPRQFGLLEYHQLSWFWFAGCDQLEAEGLKLEAEGIKTLVSPLLSNINGNVQERRNLWQQIKNKLNL